MVDLTIVSPSHDRAGLVTAFAAFGPELLLCVAESQAPAYREAYPDCKLDLHPDSIVGLGPKMTWMYDKYGAFFRVDDDAKKMRCHMYGAKKDSGMSALVEPAVARDVVQRLADQADQMGVFVFGLSGETMPNRFAPQTPFRMSGMIDGGKSGFLPGSKIWWPDDIAFADDFWAAALNAFEHRYCLVDERYVLPTGGSHVGGLGGVRTTTAVWEKATFLVDTFGDEVVEIQDNRGREAKHGTWADPGITATGMASTYPWRMRLPW